MKITTTYTPPTTHHHPSDEEPSMKIPWSHQEHARNRPTTPHARRGADLPHTAKQGVTATALFLYATISTLFSIYAFFTLQPVAASGKRNPPCVNFKTSINQSINQPENEAGPGRENNNAGEILRVRGTQHVRHIDPPGQLGATS